MAESRHLLARAVLIFATVLVSVYVWTQQSLYQSRSNGGGAPDLLTNVSYAAYPRAEPDPIGPGDRNQGKWQLDVEIGSWLVCMMNAKPVTGVPSQSEWTDYNDIEGYGWRIAGVDYGEDDEDDDDDDDDDEDEDEDDEEEDFHPQDFNLIEPFEELGISMNKDDWTKVKVTHEKVSHLNGVLYPPTDGQYINYYNVKDGVIVAEANYGPDYTAFNVAQDQIVHLKQWSDLVYLTWRNSEQATRHASNLHNLRHVFRISVINIKTKQGMADVMAKESPPIQMSPKRQMVSLPWPGLQKSISDDAAKVLMSTPNAGGVAWLLGQHKSQFGVRVVDEVRIFSITDTGFTYANMYFHITEGPLEKGQVR